MTFTVSDRLLPLDRSLADFVTSAVSMHVAAVVEGSLATVVRGLGCRVNAARDRVSVLLARSQSGLLLQAADTNHRIAAVFSQPQTNKTIQIKGDDAVVRAASAGDPELLADYQYRFGAALLALQVPESFTYAMCSCAPGDLAVVTFSPRLAYRQTPGGAAGDPLPIGGVLP